MCICLQGKDSHLLYVEKNTNEFLPGVVSCIKPHKVGKQSDWSGKDIMQEDQIQQNYPGIKLTWKKEGKPRAVRRMHETNQEPQK